MIYNDFPKKLEIFNQNSVLSCLKETPGDVSRAYVAKQVGLSRTTVSAAVNHLIDLELVQEVDKSSEPISRGRPGIPVTLTEDVWYAAGATLIDHEVLFVLLSLRGETKLSFSLPLPDLSAESYLTTLEAGFQKLAEHCPGKLLPTLGIGSPGAIHDGMITTAFDMNWSEVPIAKYLQEKLGMPSEVINRHWASCLAEYHTCNSYTNMIYIGISTGIAAAIIVDGILFTGAYHSAGEIGHTIVNPDGPMCDCGRRGCLQSLSSERALSKLITNHYKIHCGPVLQQDPLWDIVSSGRDLEIEDICAAAKHQHPLAKQQLENASKYLGLSISNLIGMFNPQCVVLGGSLVDHAGPEFTDRIIEHIMGFSHFERNNQVSIMRWTRGRYSGAIGAAHLVLNKAIELAEAATK